MTKTQAVDIHGRSYHRTIMFVLMLIATLAGSLMQSTLGTALPTLMDKFSIDLNTAQQATTWFLLALGVMVPVPPPCSEPEPECRYLPTWLKRYQPSH